MSNKEQEYKEMFLAEAIENYEELNRLFVQLEKNSDDKNAVDAIFRITHTLKGNAMGLGFDQIADLSHVMEDIFGAIKEGEVQLVDELFNNLFKANDKLGALIDSIKTEKRVSYKGIRTKLEVYLNKVRGHNEPENINNEKAVEVLAEEEVPVVQNEADEEIDLSDLLNEESDLEEEEETKITFSDQVSIPVRKLDSLMNLVGELIIEKDGLMASGNSTSQYSRLHRITSDLQYGVMDVRLVQIGFMFNKFHRILRDVTTIEGKKAELILEGTEIEIDRNILKSISDSMVHLVRNAISHGVEDAEVRKSKGKDEVGKVILRARNEKDTVFIDVIDDGAGIDHKVIKAKAIEKGIINEEYAKQMSREEVYLLIFEAGFSNAEKITEVSGRGVGMDVVKRATESIGGRINVKTELGVGTTITLSLPSSMAVKGALLFEMNKQEYAVPLSYTEAVISLKKKEIHKISRGLMASYLDKTLSIILLDSMFQGAEEMHRNAHKAFDLFDDDQKLDVLVVSYNNKFIGFVVDKLLQQKEIVEKTLSNPLDSIPLFSGATILGNGNVCLVLDIANILNGFFKENKAIANAELE